MQQTSLLAHRHADLITHLTYDFYGERLATCSADQKIKLFHRSSEGTWDLETEWKAHDAPIIKLSFAHPSHGSLLASCSHDRTIRIWEEPSPSQVAQAKDGRWVERGVLTDAKGSVKAVEFGPSSPNYGLRLASIATDSYLRIHSSLDPSLNDWSLSHDIHIPSLLPSSPEESQADGASTNELAFGGWGLSWCKERWWGNIIAVFAGTSPVVKIIILDPTPTCVLRITPPSTSSLTSLSWAPSCGRSYHLLATGARDGTVRIWRVDPPESDGEPNGRKDEWKCECVGEFGRGGARVGMVDWNLAGTMLTTSDDDGVIRIFKPTYAKTWKLLGKLTAEEPEET
ncbi:hypothetical protein M231_02761 [Tremella mesenterica]|uniref:Nucleoporin SEH1 n=1 Tax=Tremella mesenterica TaxID=5217 RepID=A0A4Q1BPX5_TREME|nr:uncharacterized protein TREMEDRAFT_43841 [Tremella mesenterica DSM 1558]EIW70255.1 hypothetical protein TREMEDRAFT_43841 [Tremella mesenterica DSM 1558]RXK39966.1 hypothetical protein M231_02761 [Tremella mesenterica]